MGEGNPNHDEHGRFSSGDGSSLGREKYRGGGGAAARAYVAGSATVHEHAHRAEYHAKRAQEFLQKATSARSVVDKKKFALSAAVSAKHAATCARRARRAGGDAVQVARADAAAKSAKEHAKAASDHVDGRTTAAPAPAPSVSRQPEQHDKRMAALAEIDKTKAEPMATSYHKNFKDPRGFINPTSKARFESSLKEIAGKHISLEDVTHGFAVPDGYRAELSELGTYSPRLSWNIKTDSGQQVGTMTREFRTKNGKFQVYHDFLRIEEGHQGGGISDTVNGNAFRHYEKWGVDQAAVTSAWIGRYAWNRLGFKFADPDAIVSSAKQFIERHPHLRERKAELLAEAKIRVGKSGPDSIASWDIAGTHPSFTPSGPKASKNPVGMMRFPDTFNDGDKVQKQGLHFGQALLLSGSTPTWRGTMDISRSNPGYMHAITKASVVPKRADASRLVSTPPPSPAWLREY